MTLHPGGISYTYQQHLGGDLQSSLPSNPTMLRWLAGSGGNSSAGGNSSGGGGSSAGSDYLGKVLRVENLQLSVEEVIAEGV